jgi:hypothetical protein
LRHKKERPTHARSLLTSKDWATVEKILMFANKRKKLEIINGE